MFKGWNLVFFTRLVISAVNIAIIILALRLLPKLMINLYWRFRKQPSKGQNSADVDMELFKKKAKRGD
jgi:hypothetical protein